MFIFIIGTLACITSTVSLVPQIYKTYQTKSVEDISSLMLWNFCACSVLWIIYGFSTGSITVWITNIIMLFCSIILLIFKIKYGPDNEA